MMEVAAPKRKSHEIEYPIASLISGRRSTRAFSDQPIEAEKIGSLFEATRWAPSSTNEQPWRYIYAVKGQPLWDQIFETLNDGNKLWAKSAPLLIVSLTKLNFTRFEGVNEHAHYDVGGANSLLAIQAVALGLQVRQMGGFNRGRLSDALRVPDGFEIPVVMAAGYPGEISELPEPLQNRERAVRERFVQEEFVMNQSF